MPTQDRGRRRRAALRHAAADLLEEGGFAVVTHRRVAERAGLPLAATTYYFADRDELVVAAFDEVIDRELARLRDLLSDVPRDSPQAAIAGIVAALLPNDEVERQRQLALWELYLQAGRGSGELRRLARAWNDGCVKALAPLLRAFGVTLAEPEIRTLVTLVDGLVLDAIIEDRPNARAEVTARACRILTALLATPSWTRPGAACDVDHVRGPACPG